MIGGIGLVLFASVTRFPVGCSLTISCPAEPPAWWSTYWPNYLVIDAGFILLAVGAYNTTRKLHSARRPIGFGLILAGMMPLLAGIGFGSNVPQVLMSCLANGCGTLTPEEYLSLYWPNYVAITFGIALIIVGAVLALRRGEHKRGTDQQERVVQPPRRRRVERLGFPICFVLGVAALVLGAPVAVFPPFPPGVTYSPLLWRDLFFTAPFILAVGFLLGGSAENEKGVESRG